MRRTSLAAAAVGLVALLLAAGCGSSTDSSTGASATAGAAQAPASTVKGTPITVGFVCSCSGPLAKSIGRSPEVIQAWAKSTNANGGINGHPVKVVTADDGQNPAKGLEAVKGLIEKDNVIAIVGSMSLTTASWQKYVSSKGVPVVGGTPVEAAFLTNPDFFISGSNLVMTFYGMLDLAKKQGKKHVGLFYCAETPVCAQASALISGLAKPLGLAVTTSRISSTAPNYTAPCLSFKQKGVDALIVAVSGSEVPRVVGSCAQQGFKPVTLAGSGTLENSWAKDPNMDGTLVAAANAVYTDTNVPGVKAFTETMNQYAPGLTGSAQYGWPLLGAWAGGEVFAAAAKAAQITPTSTPADVKNGLYALKDETADGVAPPLTYPQGKPGFPPCYFQAKLSGGQVQPLNNSKPVCASPAVTKAIAAALAG